MTAATAIFNILTTDANVGPVIANGSKYKCYPLTAPLQAVTPFITMQDISSFAQNNKNTPASVDAETWQINIVHNSYDEAVTLAKKVRTALDKKQGTFAGVTLQYCGYQSKRVIYDDRSKLQGAVMIAQDYLIRIVN